MTGDQHRRGDSPPPADGSRDRLSGVVAVVIAFTTFVAALVGFLQADASNQAGNNRKEAEQYALAALSSAQSSRETAHVELETFAQWVEQRGRAGQALLAMLYEANDPARQAELIREQERWETVAAATLRQSDIDPESEFGPELDPAFPRRYFATATQESVRLYALQDAANEQAERFDERAASYTAILAVLAVALYLFGLTLAVEAGWLRHSFLAVALAMLTVGLLWVTQTAFAPPIETSEDAASEYAQGRVMWQTAATPDEFRAAAAHYDRVIELRPNFARAYVERAAITFTAASPQRSGFFSIAPPEALASASVDLKTAVGLGLDNASTLGNVGFNDFAQGVQSADLTLLNESVGFSQRAIALDATEPIYRYNLGAALTAMGRFEDARSAYDGALLATIYLDQDAERLRGEPFVEESWLAGALTDLEIVRRHSSALAAVTGRQDYETQLRSLKEQLVGRVSRQSVDPPPSSPAVFTDITVQIFPSELQWSGTVDNYDKTRDTISAQWYHGAPDGSGWAVIPEVSQTAEPDEADGRLYQLTAYTGRVVPAACLPPGDYRVELYVNGRLAAEASGTTSFDAYEAFLAPDLTIGYCRPADWVRRDDRMPGLIDGYTSADGAYGAYIARWSLPGSLREFDSVAPEVADLTVNGFAHWFPAQPTYNEAVGTTDEYFMGLARRGWRTYDYGTGTDAAGSIRVASGVTGDGAVLVGMVLGPNEWFAGAEPYRILDSMIRTP